MTVEGVRTARAGDRLGLLLARHGQATNVRIRQALVVLQFAIGAVAMGVAGAGITMHAPCVVTARLPSTMPKQW